MPFSLLPHTILSMFSYFVYISISHSIRTPSTVVPHPITIQKKHYQNVFVCYCAFSFILAFHSCQNTPPPPSTVFAALGTATIQQPTIIMTLLIEYEALSGKQNQLHTPMPTMFSPQIHNARMSKLGLQNLCPFSIPFLRSLINPLFFFV